MEFFERIEQMSHRRPTAAELATQLLEKLAQAVAEAPDPAFLDRATYIHLYNKRVERARKSYARALTAMTRSEIDYCIDHCEYGLLQLELAMIHAKTQATSLMQQSQPSTRIDLPDFPESGCEEIIRTLTDGLCRFKQFVEYKGMALEKSLKSKLSSVVQNLQDAIENYARADHATAADVGAIGMVWLEYIYAALSGERLFAQALQPKRMRPIFALAGSAGIAASNPSCVKTESGLEKIANLEHFLASSIDAYLDNDQVEMEKFARLGSIEAAALVTYNDRKNEAKSSGEIMPASATADDGASSSLKSGGEITSKGSFKRITEAISDLVERHHTKPHKAAIALRELQSTSLSLRRSMRNESWQEASRLLEICRAECQILRREIGKMTD